MDVTVDPTRKVVKLTFCTPLYAAVNVVVLVVGKTVNWAAFPETVRESFRRAGWALVNLPTPTFTGVRVLDNFPLATLRDYIDWTPLFHAWGLKGVYPRILEHEEQGEQARQLFADANALLDRIIEENPLLRVAKDPAKHLVAFVAHAEHLDPLRPLLEQTWTPDALAMTRRAAYLWCSTGLLESKMSQAVARKAGTTITMRNWTTVLKLQAAAKDTT